MEILTIAYNCVIAAIFSIKLRSLNLEYQGLTTINKLD